jgi:hypothetical protein
MNAFVRWKKECWRVEAAQLDAEHGSTGEKLAIGVFVPPPATFTERWLYLIASSNRPEGNSGRTPSECEFLR